MQNILEGNRAAAPERPALLSRFTATLQPGRSLPPEGCGAFLFKNAATIQLSILAFVVLGAWPLPGLWAFDAALCYAVYRWKYSAGELSEKVELTEEELRVTRIHPSGKKESWNFNPYWVRFEHRRGHNVANELRLMSHGRALVFGMFLSDAERASFARALNAALARQRSRLSMHAQDPARCNS